MRKAFYNNVVDDQPIRNDATMPVSMPRLFGNLQQATNTIAVAPLQNLQKAINAVAKLGGGIVQLTNGTYNLNNHIVIPSNVTLQGSGLTVLDFGGQAYQIQIVGSDAYSTGTVSVNNAGTTVTGTGTVWDSTMEGQSILIGDFWYVIDTVSSTTSLDILSPFLETTITGEVYMIATTVDGVTLSGFVVQNSSTALIKTMYVNGITIDGVFITGGSVGIDADYTAYLGAFNFTVDTCATGITFDTVPFTTLWNFLISNITSGGAFVFNGNTNSAIGFGSLQSIVGDAINLTNCANIGIDNIAIDTVTGNGVDLFSSNSDLVITNVYIANCSEYGIKVTSNNARCIINTINFVDNTKYGIYVASGATNTDNVITSNSFNGNVLGDMYHNDVPVTVAGNMGDSPFSSKKVLKMQNVSGSSLSEGQLVVGGVPGSNVTKVMTAVGNAQIDTAQLKFGTASGLFDGTGDYLTTPDSADWAFGTGKFTIDCWVRLTTVATSHLVVGQINDGVNFWGVAITPTTLTFGSITAGAWDVNFTIPKTWVINTWYHIEIVRDGSTSATWHAFIDGVEGTKTLATGAYTGTIYNSTSVLYTGSLLGTFATDFNGWMDELRISNGVARHTTGFTPSTTPYSADVNTDLLLHMDGTDASTTFTDDSATNPQGDQITTTTTAGDNHVVGMVMETIADQDYGFILIEGFTTKLKVNGTTDIATNDWITAYSVAGIGAKAAVGNTVIAKALESYTANDSSGVIDALIIAPRLI